MRSSCFLLLLMTFFLGTSPIFESMAQDRLEPIPSNIITERKRSISGIVADFHTRTAYDYWIEKPKLGLPSEKEKAKLWLRKRTLYFTREESEAELDFIQKQQLVSRDFLQYFKEAFIWGEEQKAKSIEDLRDLAKNYPKTFEQKETQDDYEFYFNTLSNSKKRLEKFK